MLFRDQKLSQMTHEAFTLHVRDWERTDRRFLAPAGTTTSSGGATAAAGLPADQAAFVAAVARETAILAKRKLADVKATEKAKRNRKKKAVATEASLISSSI